MGGSCTPTWYVKGSSFIVHLIIKLNYVVSRYLNMQHYFSLITHQASAWLSLPWTTSTPTLPLLLKMPAIHHQFVLHWWLECAPSTDIITRQISWRCTKLRWVCIIKLTIRYLFYCIPVLHPHHKLNYFKTAGWEADWIKAAHSIVCEEFNRTYAFMDIDNPNINPKEVSKISIIYFGFNLIHF